MSWMKSLDDWTHSGYSIGHGWKDLTNAPNWGFQQLLRPERRGKSLTQNIGDFGNQTRTDILNPLNAFGKGLFGTGGYSYLSGEQGLIPNAGWKPNGQGKKTPIVDTSGNGGGLVNITVPPINIPAFPKLPDVTMPKIDLSGVKIPDMPAINVAMPQVKLPSLIGGGDGSKSDIPVVLGIGGVLLAVFLMER